MNPTTANEARIDEWLDRLATETDEAAHSAEFTAYLQALARFWRYSHRNTILIRDQCPTARHINSRTRWTALGYRLKSGVSTSIWGPPYPLGPIRILCPHYALREDPETKEKKEVLIDFRTGPVFEISQVEPGPEAQPLTPPWYEITGDPEELYGLLLRACRRLSISVTLEPMAVGCHGRSDGKGHIVLSDGISLGEGLHALIHELAHEVVHPAAARMAQRFTRQEVECQAEAVAYVVAEALSFRNLNSPTYLALHGVTRKVLQANAEAIQRGVKRILVEVEKVTTQNAATVAA